jgi:hypothetical protein
MMKRDNAKKGLACNALLGGGMGTATFLKTLIKKDRKIPALWGGDFRRYGLLIS